MKITQEFKKEDIYYSKFIDALHLSDIRYIKSIPCRIKYKDEWWEKYDNLAIKEFIGTNNIKLFEIIPITIIRCDSMINCIAKSNSEIIFNEYCKYVDNIIICKIYYNINITNTIKKLCINREHENNIDYEKIVSTQINILYKKINNFGNELCLYSIFIYDYNTAQSIKAYSGSGHNCDIFKKHFIRNVCNTLYTNKIGGNFIDCPKSNECITLHDLENDFIIRDSYNTTILRIGLGDPNGLIDLYTITMVRHHSTNIHSKLKLIDLITMNKNVAVNLLNFNFIKKETYKRTKNLMK